MPIGVGEPHYAQMIRSDRLKNIWDVYPETGWDPQKQAPSEVATQIGKERIERDGLDVELRGRDLAVRDRDWQPAVPRPGADDPPGRARATRKRPWPSRVGVPLDGLLMCRERDWFLFVFFVFAPRLERIFVFFVFLFEIGFRHSAGRRYGGNVR